MLNGIARTAVYPRNVPGACNANVVYAAIQIPACKFYKGSHQQSITKSSTR